DGVQVHGQAVAAHDHDVSADVVARALVRVEARRSELKLETGQLGVGDDRIGAVVETIGRKNKVTASLDQRAYIVVGDVRQIGVHRQYPPQAHRAPVFETEHGRIVEAGTLSWLLGNGDLGVGRQHV